MQKKKQTKKKKQKQKKKDQKHKRSPIFDVVSFQVQTELSFVVASLSLYSAHVSVDPTVVVRVMLV